MKKGNSDSSRRSLKLPLSPAEWNNTRKAYPENKYVHELFEEQAERSPDAMAVVFEDQGLTYEGLNRRANQLAHHLRKSGVGPDTLVGLCVERSVEMLIALLGILKAGGAYVPMDPSYPLERIVFMLKDSQARILLTQSSLASSFRLSQSAPGLTKADRFAVDVSAPDDGCKSSVLTIVCLDKEWQSIARQSHENPRVMLWNENLAYVIYTSGSTGQPKGAAIRHRGLVNYLDWCQKAYPLDQGNGSLVHSSIAFDLTITGLFAPLAAGRRIKIVPEKRYDIEQLAQALLEEKDYSLIKITPAHLALLNQQMPPRAAAGRTRAFIIGGENLAAQSLSFWQEHAPETRFINEYGPTETVVGCCVYEVPRGERRQGSVPIGKPIINTQLYILNSYLQPVPVGVIGELYISGDGLARGYLNRPDLTADKFRPDLFSREPGKRMYQTGDLVRYLADGNIEYLGRTDLQVKIRGFRIELEEIEAVLLKHEHIRACVADMVSVRSPSPNEKEQIEKALAVYYVSDKNLTVSELKAHVSRSLPDYMVPSFFMPLKSLPLTFNGKVDRKALPAPEYQASAEAYIAPRTPVEETLSKIFSEVLGIERVGINDNFFNLGGHSLIATTLLERMRQNGLHADLRSLFNSTTLAELAAAVSDKTNLVEVPPNLIPAQCKGITPEMLTLLKLSQAEIDRIVDQVSGGAANVQDIYPLAPLQEGILFHHLLSSKRDAYLLSTLFRFDACVLLERFLDALQKVIDRHDVLRTAVVWEGLPEPVQVVWRKAPLPVEEVVLNPAAGDAAEQMRMRFDPRHIRFDVRRAPLQRAYIAYDAPKERWLLLILFHHLMGDHTTQNVIQKEMQAFLLGKADQLPKPLPFRNFVAQARLEKSQEEHEAFFRQMLGDVDEPTAPFGLLNVQGDGSGIQEARLAIKADLARRVRERARLLKVSAASICHLAWAQVLARVSGREDVVFGTVLFGRMQGGEGADQTMGLFINTLPIRIRAGEEGVETGVRYTQALLTNLMHHEHAPLALAQRCSAISASKPLFSALLNYIHSPSTARTPSAEDLRAWSGMAQLSFEERTNYPFSLDVNDLGTGFSLMAQVQTPIEPMRVCRFMETALMRLVEALEQAPKTPIRSLDILSAAEWMRVVEEFNRTDTAYPKNRCVHKLFEEQAGRTPESIALVFADQALTYEQLNGRANQLAHYLSRFGVGPETLVGIGLERSLETMIGLLGVLKAGGAYVPLDPGYPQERLAFILEDSKAKVLLTQSSLASRFAASPSSSFKIVCLDSERQIITNESLQNPMIAVHPENPTYAIYTSGSTGVPKGVLVTHHSLVNHNAAFLKKFDLNAQDRVLQFAAFGFDVSIEELFPAWLSGAVVILQPDAVLNSMSDFQRFADQDGITVLNLPASFWHTWVSDLEHSPTGLPRSIRLLITGSEPVLAERFTAWKKFVSNPVRFCNAYGTTETTITTTLWEAPSDSDLSGLQSIPIGRPIDNAKCYLLDERLRPVPLGVPGELYIGGLSTARGYLNNSILTAERFIPNPFMQKDSEIEFPKSALRLFKTGDLARYLEDGTIELLGRIDSQVKIRGFRIELGEVEAILGGHPDVKETAVTVWEDEQKTKRLAAYVVLNKDKNTSPRFLQNYLKDRLPEYMIPSAFVILDAMPLTPNGKVDRKALPIPDKRNLGLESGYKAPSSEAEKKIAAIWSEVLGLESVGVHSNFFDLGGHSLLVLRMHQKLKAVFDKEITVRDLFRYTTIAALAQYYDPACAQSDAVIEKAAERVLARQNAQPSDEIAIIGMAGCFPGASTIDTLWKNLQEGKESVTFFTDEELLAAGVDAEWLKDPRYVKAHAIISDIDCFDARFFGVNPREAEMMDPQQRLFLEYAWRALEDAGYDSEQYHRPIGVFAGSGENTYLPNNLYPNQEYIGINDQYQIIINNSKDFLATQVSYKLNLTGPSMTVQTACSTSLVAVYEACQSLLNQKCDMALAGGISLSVPQVSGYIYTPEGILSPDGHCRPFDSKAQGTVCGQGIGLVVLKRLRDALKDGDTIHAVIKGSAINNDGARKIGYTAPSEDGQVEVITEALTMAKVNPESITYVEAHGTGTALGDPIEVAALTRSFRYHTQNKQYCALGSVKSNIGHLDTAAGIAGLIKTVLCLKNKQLVPSLHFTEPNPAIHISESPFYVNTELREWKSNGQARRAGVSSFGLGGTNAHVIVEEAPSADETDPAKTEQLIVLSAKTAEALEEASVNIAVFLGEHPETNLADAAYTLQAGRRSFEYRRALVCTSTADAASTLETNDPERVYTFHETARHRPLYFMFPGGGSQYVNMGRVLYTTEMLFRDIMDQCALFLQPQLGLNLLDLFYPPSGKEEAARKKLEQIVIQQPGLFVIEYALARVWQSWGLKPQAMIGHSLGEYVAACLAGVFDLKDAVSLVAARGRLMQSMPKGRMLSVALPEADLKPLLNEEMSIGTINGPAYCVVSGTIEAVTGLERQLTEKGVDHRRIHISHASHSPMMDPILKSFENEVRRVALHPPKIPYLSNRSGTWIKPEEAMDPVYWAQHLRQTVRFADGIKVLLQKEDGIFLEVGPGHTLSIFAKQQQARTVLNSLPHPEDKTSDREFFLNTLGRLWLYGENVDWKGFYGKECRRKIFLPTYPFERQRYWTEPTAHFNRAKTPILSGKKANIADWFYVPAWKQAILPISRVWEQEKTLWLVFEDDYGFGSRLVDYLEQKNQEAIIVKASRRFRKINENNYRLNPGLRSHYSLLFKQIGRSPSRIVHLWNITTTKHGGSQLESLEKDLDLSFYSLVFLAQAIGEQAWPVTTPIKIGVVSNNMQSVMGDEENLSPQKAPLLGPCKIIPIEYPDISCSSLDIVLPQVGSKTEVDLIRNLVDEMSKSESDPVVAYRGRHRWTPIYEPIRLTAEHEKIGWIRQGGIYLITGGLGGMGLVLAEYLARSAQAKLILINRAPFPRRADWETWLTIHDDQDKISRKIRKLQSIEAFNSEILILSADVSDRFQMQDAIDQACKRFGAIQGIFHLAGVGGGGIVQLDNRKAASKVFAAKIKGTMILDEIFANTRVDVFMVASSLNSILGEAGLVDYAAANAFLDAFALRGAVSARHSVVVNWDIWQEVGMAMEIDVPENLREKHEKLLKLGMNPQEGLEALKRILCSELKQVIVSTQDFGGLINKERCSVTNTSKEVRQIQQPQPNYPRPRLQNIYAAPSNETEEKLSVIWQEFLGLEKVGIQDNFFELGGHSLLATRIISQIRKVFQIDLSIRTFLEVKNIARMSKLIEDACWIRQKTASHSNEAIEEGNI